MCTLKKTILGGTMLLLGACSTEGEAPVTFSNESLDALVETYSGAQIESVSCLEGHKENGQYFIQKVYGAEHVSQDETSALANCADSDTYIGRIHNHPSGECALSDVDKAGFYMSGETEVYGVVCHADKGNTPELRMIVKTKPGDWYNQGRRLEEITTSTIEY